MNIYIFVQFHFDIFVYFIFYIFPVASMSFWSENYSFIKDVYDTRVSKMIEWMDHVEMAIQKVMMIMMTVMVMMIMDHIKTAIQKVTQCC